MSRENLAIQEGGQASREYLRAMFGGISAGEKADVLESLREYCRQDTVAMVDLLRVLESYG